MNPYLHKLYNLALKKERIILGLMSGTSFDGLDLALCRVGDHGRNTSLELLEFETRSFPDSFKEELKSVFARKDGSLETVCLLNPYIAIKHAEIINDCLGKWKIRKEEVDLLASHGQTIYHAPAWMHKNKKYPNATLQLGDGDHLAVHTGLITIHDFRQKHIAAGGEGAPLAVYGDYLVFSSNSENRVMLNIGGIANFTWLPANGNFDEVFSTDVGPGNTMMDAFVQNHFPGKYFDEGGTIARSGTPVPALVQKLGEHQFFKKGFPKTTGPELFNIRYLQDAMAELGITPPLPDQLASLNRFSANMIAEALNRSVGNKDYKIYVSGGGMHNPVLIENLREHLPGKDFVTTSDLNIHPDAKEAVLFALLANECVCGGQQQQAKSEGIPWVTMGKISFPA